MVETINVIPVAQLSELKNLTRRNGEEMSMPVEESEISETLWMVFWKPLSVKTATQDDPDEIIKVVL